jgi:lipopolysaccharide transport system ATP-binding protein
MSDIVIKVENLSKQYRLGQVGTGTLKDDFKRWRYKIMGREDPFLTIGDENNQAERTDASYVWALKNINFEVKQGDILGIVGKNGAGKSTLLKILSRTTGPTIGSLKMNGRVASLLEVGTGFHSELSGRENIFLNGAIMGMSKSEIRRKFDEIVDFAGVEKYIDTPVKRYSSGMYVRLAFGVAAHLEPDILIVDEVLAVGDAEFQKKALGKMQDVSQGQGRTILFVSHNMAIMQKLCKTGLLLKNGSVSFSGTMRDTIEEYLFQDGRASGPKEFLVDNKLKASIVKVILVDDEGRICSEIPIGVKWSIKVYYEVHELTEGLVAAVGITNQYEVPIKTSWQEPFKAAPGVYCAEFREAELVLATGSYNINIGLSYKSNVIQYIENAVRFNIIEIVDNISSTVLKYDSHTGIILNPMLMNTTKVTL